MTEVLNCLSEYDFHCCEIPFLDRFERNSSGIFAVAYGEVVLTRLRRSSQVSPSPSASVTGM